MKKITSYLVALMMVLTMVPYTAFAGTDESQPEAKSINLYVEQPNPLYSDEERTVKVVEKADKFKSSPQAASDDEYVATTDEATLILREGMVKRQSAIVINMKITEADFSTGGLNALGNAIYEGVFDHTGKSAEGDALRWSYERIAWASGAEVRESNYYATFTFKPTYYTTAAQEEELAEAIEALKDELALDGKNDYEKIKAIYDYMAANISYDYENLNDPNYDLKYTAYAALVNKTSVCQGYAILLYRLALEYGIDIRVITGASENNRGELEGHAWNIVKLGGKYYNLDSTWDSTWDSNKKNHTFFLKGSKTFDNHMSNNEYKTAEFKAVYPISETDYVPGSEPLTVVTQPEAVYCNVGDVVSFTVKADGGKKPYTYRWQTTSSVANGWFDFVEGDEFWASGWETDILTVKVYKEDFEDGCLFRCIITDADGKSVTSETAEILPKDEYVCPEGEHEYVQSDILEEPTCTEKGLAEMTCSICGDVQHEIIDVIEHTEVIDEAVDATCEEDGLTEGKHCSECGTVLTAQIPITAPGHSFKWVVDKAATEDETGLKHEECENCGDVRNADTVIDKLAHTHKMIRTEAEDPTCTAEGNIEYWTCETCGKLYTDEAGLNEITEADTVIGAKEHSYGSWETVKEPTTSDTGEKVRICSVCGDEDTDVIPELPADDILWGDADGNGRVLANDAMLVLQYSTKANDGSSINLKACDVDGNSRVLANDAMLILQYSTKVISKFPVDK